MAKLKLADFKVSTVTISNKNINKFCLLAANQARKKREPKIKAIMRKLKGTKTIPATNFDAPIVVTKNGQLTVIDGQHRITAIERIIADDPTFEIEVTLFQYEEKLSKEQCDLFRNWNSGTPQSTDDFIQMFSHDLKFWNKLNQAQFTTQVGGVSIYPSSDEMHFRKWVGSYTAAMLKSPGGNSLTNEKFIDKIRSLDLKEDYNNFFDMMLSIKRQLPSIFERGYRQGNTTGAGAIIYIYYHSVSMGKLDESDFWKAYHKHVAPNVPYEDALKMTGGSATTVATEMLQKLINKGLSKANQIKAPSV